MVKPQANHRTYRRPFWLPAPAYYVLTLSAALAVFFLIWGILHEGEDMPWVLAGVSSAVVITSAVILREYFLRRSRNRFLQAEKRLDENLAAISALNRLNANKFTLEKNAVFLKEIERKSEAAKILANISEAHFGVVEACNEYLLITERELPLIAAGSPRISAIGRGREKVKILHKQHLYAWAASESKSLTQEAKIRATISEKIEAAQKALSVLDTALRYYPDESQFLDSAEAVKELIVSVKVSHWTEQAEREAFKGNYKRAVNHYQDALFFLHKENLHSEEREIITEKINGEIEKLRGISVGKATKRIPQNSKKK